MKKIKQLQQSIRKKIQEDKHFQHCRINVVNGVNEFFRNYKETLAKLESKEVTVRFYKNGPELYEDLFLEKDFMAKDWFNLFVFNLCGYDSSVRFVENEIKDIEILIQTLKQSFDSKYYSTLIVSTTPLDEINHMFESYTGRKSPIQHHRYIDPSFDEVYILEHLNKTIHTHSTKFLERWNNALENLERLTSTPLPKQSLSV